MRSFIVYRKGTVTRIYYDELGLDVPGSNGRKTAYFDDAIPADKRGAAHEINLTQDMVDHMRQDGYELVGLPAGFEDPSGKSFE